MTDLLKRVLKVANTPTCKNCKNQNGDKCHLCCIGNYIMSGCYWESKHTIGLFGGSNIVELNKIEK